MAMQPPNVEVYLSTALMEPLTFQDHHRSSFKPLAVSHVEPMEPVVLVEVWPQIVSALMLAAGEEAGESVAGAAGAAAAAAVEGEKGAGGKKRPSRTKSGDDTAAAASTALQVPPHSRKAIEVLEAAVNRGWRPQVKPFAQTALHFAVLANKLEVVDWLFVNGADLQQGSAPVDSSVDVKWNVQASLLRPIEVAAGLGWRDGVKYLLQRGAAVGFALHAAAAGGHVDVVKLLLKHGAWAGLRWPSEWA
jgi:hypothetical protein